MSTRKTYLEQINYALQQIKNNKATRDDEILPKILNESTLKVKN